MAIDKKHIKAVTIALTATYLASMFTACDQAVKPSETTSATTATGTAETTDPTTTKETKPLHKYVHKEEGYYNIDEIYDGLPFVAQTAGTCWICASIYSMSSAYKMKTGRTIDLEEMKVLYEIYDDDKEEGVFITPPMSKEQGGGLSFFAVNELSRGFGEGLVLDEAISAENWSRDEIKEGLKKYGALYIGIPDTDASKKGAFDGYFTMNFPDAKPEDYDHSITIIGWDDNFPKEYFREKASQDGAWITYNSNNSAMYYYVSYDTEIDQLQDPPCFLSVSDDYSKVVSYDCGSWDKRFIKTGDSTETANVFDEKGTLAAVGTFTLGDDQDLTVKIMSKDFSECIYSQDCHIDRAGYHVIKIDTPLEVDGYAIAVTYPGMAPIEGTSVTPEEGMEIRITSGMGQSFVHMDGKWLDLADKETCKKVGKVTNNCCIKALYK